MRWKEEGKFVAGKTCTHYSKIFPILNNEPISPFRQWQCSLSTMNYYQQWQTHCKCWGIITLPSSCELNNEFILLQHTYGVDLVDRVDRQDGLDPMLAQIATTPHLTVRTLRPDVKMWTCQTTVATVTWHIRACKVCYHRWNFPVRSYKSQLHQW